MLKTFLLNALENASLDEELKFFKKLSGHLERVF